MRRRERTSPPPLREKMKYRLCNVYMYAPGVTDSSRHPIIALECVVKKCRTRWTCVGMSVSHVMRIQKHAAIKEGAAVRKRARERLSFFQKHSHSHINRNSRSLYISCTVCNLATDAALRGAPRWRYRSENERKVGTRAPFAFTHSNERAAWLRKRSTW